MNMKNNILASVMICELPKYFNGRLILSGYHGVWEAVKEIPAEIRPYLTDDVGNKEVSYGGLLQIIDTKALMHLDEWGLFACFRGVHEEFFELVQTSPPYEVYANLINDLKLVGWDISTSNGWCSASCEGIFPINPFTGEAVDQNLSEINQYGLFESLEDCLNYCRINNEKISENAPWYPVAVYLDMSSYIRLERYRQSESSK